MNRAKVNDAAAKIRGALQEAQREAMRKSTLCSVTLHTTSTPNKVTSSCLVTGDRNLDGVAMRSNLSTINFNFRGGTGSQSTIVVALPNGIVTKQKCLVIAPGIGIMRSGNYADNDTTGTDPGNCNTSQ